MEPHPALRELDLGEKAISAGVAAFLSAVVVNPLDVAKVQIRLPVGGRWTGCGNVACLAPTSDQR